MELYVQKTPIPMRAREREITPPGPAGIFIIEGAITCVVCMIGWFLVIDFPTQAGGFLTPAEQELAVARIDRDRGDGREDAGATTARGVAAHLRDWRPYCWGFNLLASTLPGYAYSYFLPVILRRGMGFGVAASQLLIAPPHVFAAALTFASGWLGDRYRVRGPLIAVHQLVTAIGMVLTAYGGSNAVRYFGAFIGRWRLRAVVVVEHSGGLASFRFLQAT